MNQNWVVQTVVQTVLTRPHWREYPELVEKLIEKGTADAAIVQYLLTQPEWDNHPERTEKLIEKLLEKGTADAAIAEYILAHPKWKDHPEWMAKIMDSPRVNQAWLAQNVLTRPHWQEQSNLLNNLLQKNRERRHQKTLATRSDTASPPNCVVRFLRAIGF